MARHGMTISDEEVLAYLRLFETIDRGGDPRVLMRSEPIRRFRATLLRIRNGNRMQFGGRKREGNDGDR